jgi:hypothetical protein
MNVPRATKHQMVRKVSADTSPSDSGSDDDANLSVKAGGDDTEPEDDPELAYLSTKMMGDVDHNVCQINPNVISMF